MKAKIKSKFQSTSFTEVNVKINKVYKDHSEKTIKKPNFIRLRFACQPHIRSDFSINLTDSLDSDLSPDSDLKPNTAALQNPISWVFKQFSKSLFTLES